MSFFFQINVDRHLDIECSFLNSDIRHESAKSNSELNWTETNQEPEVIKLPTPPVRTTSSSSMKELEKENLEPMNISCSTIISDSIASIQRAPEPPTPPPSLKPPIPTKEDEKVEKEMPKNETSGSRDEKKKGFSSKLSKLSKMSPKFGRKQIEVAKSFISKNSEISEKSEKNEKSENTDISKISKIEKLFSPKLKNRKSISPTKSLRATSPNSDVKNPQFFDPSIIDEELEEESNINLIVQTEKIEKIQFKKQEKLENSTSTSGRSSPSMLKTPPRPNSLFLEKNTRNPSLSSRVSIIDLVNDEPIAVFEDSNFHYSKKSGLSENLTVELAQVQENNDPTSPYNNSLPPTPPLSQGEQEHILEPIEEASRPPTSSSSSSDIKVPLFVRPEVTSNLTLDDFEKCSKSSGSLQSTADETISQISQMQDTISKTISRTKSYELLKITEKSPPKRVRPHSLYCGLSSSVNNGNSECSSPEELDPTLNEVKKIMKRSDIMQKLNGYDRWEIEEDYSSCEDVQTDDISVSSSSPARTPSREMKSFGSSKVGSRLATQSIIQAQPVSHLRHGHSSNPPTPHSDRLGNYT
jgi:hypothetical protein